MNKKIGVLLAGSLLLAGCSAPSPSAAPETTTASSTAPAATSPSAAPAVAAPTTAPTPFAPPSPVAATQASMTSLETCQATKVAMNVAVEGKPGAKLVAQRLKPVADQASPDLKSALLVFEAVFEEKGKDNADDAGVTAFTKTQAWQAANDSLRNICGS